MTMCQLNYGDCRTAPIQTNESNDGGIRVRSCASRQLQTINGGKKNSEHLFTTVEGRQKVKARAEVEVDVGSCSLSTQTVVVGFDL